MRSCTPARGALLARAVRRGFTITELLVSIGVITLLMSLALPVLSGIHRSGESAASLARMRDLGMFVLAFAEDHRDEMPRSAHSYLGSGLRPWEYAYYDMTLGDDEYDEPGRWLEFINRYLRCPLDRRDDRYPSFGYNVYFELTESETGGRAWRHRSITPRPTATIVFAPLKSTVLADHVMAHFWPSLDPDDYEVEPERFGPDSGYLFLDGHTDSKPFAAVYDEEESINQFDPAEAR